MNRDGEKERGGGGERGRKKKGGIRERESLLVYICQVLLTNPVKKFIPHVNKMPVRASKASGKCRQVSIGRITISPIP